MSHIPESLKREGYDKDFLKEEEIPDYLKCPSCKEIFVNPEMYSCGHSICSVCLQTKSTDQCPVCKTTSYNRIPNYIVKELLGREYPEELERRTKQFEELKSLKDKLQLYQRSSRSMKLLKSYQEYMKKNIYVHQKVLTNYLIVTNKDMNPAPSEEEISYFLATVLRNHPDSSGVIGQYLVNRDQNLEELMTWVENNKKKGVTEIKKWLPLLFFVLSQRVPNQETLKKMAGFYKLEIGEEIPVEEWRGRPPYWIKDLDIDIAPSTQFVDLSRLFFGGPYSTYDDSEGFSDSEDSEDEELFYFR